ncbi:hypothetical protein DFH08DRAFT_818668 [Mycena albidolilacea]|uniref:Uncharacterized protein n=1 Tax=Mycena albidolilacea TaxID=1033008 RepID=A0AAD6ZFQ8_9AGAR|nr:hypothetical protein DFH08DRAFT_818668 [Mycena albidolilacea]
MPDPPHTSHFFAAVAPAFVAMSLLSPTANFPSKEKKRENNRAIPDPHQNVAPATFTTKLWYPRILKSPQDSEADISLSTSNTLDLLLCSRQAQDLKFASCFLVSKTNIFIRTALNLRGYNMQYPATSAPILNFRPDIPFYLPASLRVLHVLTFCILICP